MISIRLKVKIEILINLILNTSNNTKNNARDSVSKKTNGKNLKEKEKYSKIPNEEIDEIFMMFNIHDEEERKEIIEYMANISSNNIKQIINIIKSNQFYQIIKSHFSINFIRRYIRESLSKKFELFSQKEKDDNQYSNENSLNDNENFLSNKSPKNLINSLSNNFNNFPENNKNKKTTKIAQQIKTKIEQNSNSNNSIGNSNINNSKISNSNFSEKNSFADFSINNEYDILLLLSEIFNLTELISIEIYDLFKFNEFSEINEEQIFILFFLIAAYENNNLEDFFEIFSEEIFEILSGKQKLINLNRLKKLGILLGFNYIKLNKYCRELDFCNEILIDFLKFKKFFVFLGKNYDNEFNKNFAFTNISKVQTKKKSSNDTDCFSKACNIL